MSNNPSWLNAPPPPPPPPVSAFPPQPQYNQQPQYNSPPPASYAPSGDQPPYKKTVVVTLMITNIGLAALMGATAVTVIMESDSVDDTSNVFAALYMIVFATILFVFEINQLRPNCGLDNLWKRNFGFLYGPHGKGIYILFISILCFSFTRARDLALAAGIVGGFIGFVTIIAKCMRPQYFDPKEKYTP